MAKYLFGFMAILYWILWQLCLMEVWDFPRSPNHTFEIFVHMMAFVALAYLASIDEKLKKE